uniref:Integrase catalytic domain-containing protein n=1 Tax=Tanacetum cinerariifolium TaxID=118510 RepID=A0A6L2L310_TANCI|nr:hypothetical protein [Tanacetum cinerariifolium]
MSHYYTLDEDTYPRILRDDGKGMDLFAFIQVTDPTKVKVVARERAEAEAKLLDSTVGRVVLLLSVAPAHAESELEAGDAIGYSHPRKKLKEDYGTSSEAATGGKSSSVLKELLASSLLNVEVVAALLFITSLISASLGHASGDPANSITGLNLRTIGSAERFVISLDSSHHSSINASGAEVDSIIRSVVLLPVMTKAVVTSHAINASSISVLETEAKTDSLVRPSIFHDSSSASIIRLNVVGSSHLPRKEVLMGSQEINSENLHEIREMDYHHLFMKFNVRTTRQACLNVKVRMRIKYFLSERKRLESECEKQADLLKARDDEIENLKAQLLLKEAEAAEAACLRFHVSAIEDVEKVHADELDALKQRNMALKGERDSLNGKITELQSSVSAKDLELKYFNVIVSSLKCLNDDLVDQEHPKDKTSLDASTKLTQAKLNKHSGDADLSKENLGPESPLEFRRSWTIVLEGTRSQQVVPRESPMVMSCSESQLSWSRTHTPGRANDVLSYFQLEDEGLCSGGTKLNSIFITAESQEEGVGRVLLELRVTKPHSWSVASFPPYDDRPSTTIAGQKGNTSRMINVKLNKRLRLIKPYPSSLLEQIFASATQQMLQIRKKSPRKKNFGANHEGSSSEVMYKHCFRNLIAETMAKLKESRTPLVGFSGKVSYPMGTINLKVTMGESERLQTIPMEFVVVKSHSHYNVILGRIGLRSLGAIAFTLHSMIKFPTANGITTATTKKETLHEFQRIEEAQGSTHEEWVIFLAPDSEGTISMGREESQGHPEGPLKNKPLEKVVIHDDYPDQTITIGGNMSADYRFGLIEILRKHANAFAWTLEDMTKISRSIAEHELKTYPHIEPRNARATYQRLVDTIFEGQMGRNLEAYVDDMVIKRIRANPEKAKAIVNMPSPTNLKQMQRLSEKLASLKRFISKLAEKALPCLDTLKRCTNKKEFHWKTEAEEAFQEMKKLIAELPILTALKNAIKGQVLADFLADTMARDSPTQIKESGPNDTLAEGKSLEEQKAPEANAPKNLGTKADLGKLYTYRASNKHGSGAEYEALLTGLRIAAKMKISHIPREDNKRADALSKLAVVQCEGLIKGVLIKELNERSMDTAEVNAINEEATRTWMIQIQEYIEHGILPEDVVKARIIQEKARNYTIEEGILYRKSYLGPLLRCIGMDIIGPLPEALGKVKYLIVAVDYFTKWIEAKAVTSIIGRQVKNFAFDNIICKFKIPATIIIDNETQLINDPFKSWAEGQRIKLVSISVYHPQANGAVERANQSIMQGIKTRLHQEGGAWVEELPNVLWPHRTTPKISNRETPFTLAYGTEVVIHAEIGILTRRKIQRSDKENEEALKMNLNLLKERRDINNQRSKMKLTSEKVLQSTSPS